MPALQGIGRRRQMESKQTFRITRRQFVASSAATLAAGALTRDALAFSSSSAAGGGPFRVIIDTDPGVDDALALLLAMRSPRVED